jgi:hypothetical protein
MRSRAGRCVLACRRPDDRLGKSGGSVPDARQSAPAKGLRSGKSCSARRTPRRTRSARTRVRRAPCPFRVVAESVDLRGSGPATLGLVGRTVVLLQDRFHLRLRWQWQQGKRDSLKELSESWTRRLGHAVRSLSVWRASIARRSPKEGRGTAGSQRGRLLHASGCGHHCEAPQAGDWSRRFSLHLDSCDATRPRRRPVAGRLPSPPAASTPGRR